MTINPCLFAAMLTLLIALLIALASFMLAYKDLYEELLKEREYYITKKSKTVNDFRYNFKKDEERE